MLIDLSVLRESDGGEFLKQRQTRARRPLGNTALDGGTTPETVTDGTLSIVDSSTGFELTMVNELYAGVKELGGLSSLRPVFEQLRTQLLENPLGDNDIEHDSRSSDDQKARLVKKIPSESPLCALIPGVELAIKTTGKEAAEENRSLVELGVQGRSSAEQQFRSMLEFQRLQEQHAPEGLFGYIRPAKVYGTLREPMTADGSAQREWLLMEYVTANRHVTDHEGIKNGKLVSGFKPQEYPELGRLVAGQTAPYTKLCPFDDLESLISTQYPWAEPYVGDITGENLLEVLKPRDENGVVKKQYVIIDPEPYGPNPEHLPGALRGTKI